MCLLAAWAPSIGVLVVARLLGGLSAGHGLSDDACADHRAVVGAGADEIDRAVVGASAAPSPSLGPLVAGTLLEHFWWGSVFLITLPLAVVALVMALRSSLPT